MSENLIQIESRSHGVRERFLAATAVAACFVSSFAAARSAEAQTSTAPQPTGLSGVAYGMDCDLPVTGDMSETVDVLTFLNGNDTDVNFDVHAGGTLIGQLGIEPNSQDILFVDEDVPSFTLEGTGGDVIGATAEIDNLCDSGEEESDPTPTASPTASPSPAASPTPTPSNSPSPEPSPSASAEPSTEATMPASKIGTNPNTGSKTKMTVKKSAQDQAKATTFTKKPVRARANAKELPKTGGNHTEQAAAGLGLIGFGWLLTGRGSRYTPRHSAKRFYTVK